MPRAQTSVVINTRLKEYYKGKLPYKCLTRTYDVPVRNSAMIASRSF